MTLDKYLESINNRYRAGNATEHTFRGDLQQLLETLVPGIRATNEPKRQKCGAPDYIITKKEIPVGFIEAKDIGDKDLDGTKKTGNKEQFDRYKASLGNLIFTDYLNFHLYREGQFITKVAIGELTLPSPRGEGPGVRPLPQNFSSFTNLITDFCTHISQTIKSPKRLAEMMAGKARLLSDVIEKALTSDQQTQENSTLKEQAEAFKQILIHDITPKGFADVYAQTIAYGMFAARLHDPTLPTFSRHEAAELIPRSNPFLRKLFGYIAGPDIDDRIKWIVDSLIEIFLACNVEQLLKNYGKSTKTEDPIIHFYETFLSEYDPKLRKARGVWYTPHPVVSFIVRAVDDILKTEFGLADGLANNSKTKIKVALQETDKRYKDNVKTVEEEVHRVQILDPATGTGTFLAEVIKHIHQRFAGQQGIWSSYVETHLLPRLNGFELLMASYAMAHLQLDLLLTETGYKPTDPSLRGGTTKQSAQRLRVYLTNSLEEHHPDTGTLFANWLSTEANEANRIKRDTPVMVVLGNPPYAVSSSNKSIDSEGKKTWIGKLIDDYKKDLNERKINLDDDYIKFIRFGQHFIHKNGSGVLAYISNNSFLDGVTHRQMRKHLLEEFDHIFILNLHGNSNINETAPDGSTDENVFDIRQGVSINIFIKTGKRRSALGEVLYYDAYGKREEKYDFLSGNSLKQVLWNSLQPKEPYYFFVDKNLVEADNYDAFISLDKLLPVYVSGVQTKRDSLTIKFSEKELHHTKETLLNTSDTEQLRQKFELPPDGRDWTIADAIKDLRHNNPRTIKYLYRPFDVRYTFYTGKSKGFLAYPRDAVLKNFVQENVGLIFKRSRLLGGTYNWRHVGITDLVTDLNYLADQSFVFPLYLYPDHTNQQSFQESPTRTPNLHAEIVHKIADDLNLCFVWEKNQPYPITNRQTLAPIDLLDYIYAVLHSPAYREKYKEFLKIDFPRVPYPKDAATFWKLVGLGGQLRHLHLLESPVVNNFITKYPVDGSNVVDKVQFEPYIYDFTLPNEPYPDYAGAVKINDQQYFADVPMATWEFYIGGYQPAQKWLKDRKGRKLEYEDILHYQKIIVALTETRKLMEEIDKAGVD